MMPFSYRRRVEFRDTDAAGIAHFSVFFPMMEEAEHAALRHVGLTVMRPAEIVGHLTWPRVAAHCDYLSAARFEDLLRIEVGVLRIGQTSVRYAFDFWRDPSPGDAESSAAEHAAAEHLAPEHLATGQITAVCCLWTPGQPLQKQPIPSDVRAALQRLVVRGDSPGPAA